MCWRPCIWSSLGVKLRKLDFLLRSQKYDSPLFPPPFSPHFSPSPRVSSTLWLLRDLAETVRKHSSLAHEYTRAAAISTRSKSCVLRRFWSFRFFLSFRFAVFTFSYLSLCCRLLCSYLSFPPPPPPPLIRFTSSVNIIRESRIRNAPLILFSLIWICPRGGGSSGSDAKFFYLWPGNFFRHAGEGTSRFVENVRYVRPFLHEMEFVAVCWIPANVCQQTVPFKLYMSRHGNRGPSLNSIASHERLRGFRRKFVFRRMSTSFFPSPPSNAQCSSGRVSQRIQFGDHFHNLILFAKPEENIKKFNKFREKSIT